MPTPPNQDTSSKIFARLNWKRWRTRRRATAAERVLSLFDQANGPRFEVVKSGPELENALLDAIMTRGHVLVIGLPGCGKTHNAEAAARRAVELGQIKSWVLIPATKDLVGESLFDPRLRLDKDAKNYIQVDAPVVIELVGRDALLPADKYTREQAKALWKPQDWVYVILDECTRASPQFIDHLLSVLEHFVVYVNGKNYRVPIVWAFLGNPPGMDSTTSVMTPAFFSRLSLRINLLDVDVDTQAEAITGKRLVEAARSARYLDACRPDADHVRLAAGIRFLCWGLPLDRKGLTWLPDSARRLMAEAGRLDDTLRFLMEEAGKILVFGPDSRRTTAWMLNAQGRAAGENRPFHDDDLLATVQACLQLGSKDTFTEGHRPDLMSLKTKLLFLIAHHALANPKVRDLLLRRTAPRFLAAMLAPVLLVTSPLPGWMERWTKELTELLEAHGAQLLQDQQPGLDARTRALVTFLNRVTQVNGRLPLAEVTGTVEGLAEEGAYPGEALFEGGRFVTRADQRFFASLAAIERDHLSPVGLAAAGLAFRRDADGVLTERPVGVAEQVRLAVQGKGLARQFEGLLVAWATKKPLLESRLTRIAEFLQLILEPEDQDEAVVKARDSWAVVFAHEPEEVVFAVKDLLGDVKLEASFGLHDRLSRIW